MSDQPRAERRLVCEHGFTRVCGVCDPYVASRTDPSKVAWPSRHDESGPAVSRQPSTVIPERLGPDSTPMIGD